MHGSSTNQEVFSFFLLRKISLFYVSYEYLLSKVLHVVHPLVHLFVARHMMLFFPLSGRPRLTCVRAFLRPLADRHTISPVPFVFRSVHVSSCFGRDAACAQQE